MSSAPPPSASAIVGNARWLAQALDANAGTMRLVDMNTDDYRAASFLDDRMFDSDRSSVDVPEGEVARAVAGGREDVRWIFHIGHVGSTLIARLLGELPKVLSVREPRLLRDLLSISPERRAALAATVRTLYSRTFADDQVALVKATSFVSEIAAELLQPAGCALLLTATPRNYIASILAGENSSMELEALAPTRIALMARRAGHLPAPRHLADLAAIGWACGATALEGLTETRTDATLHWCDFDRLLADKGPQLTAIADALAIPADPVAVAALATSPLLKRYSKAVEYHYSSALRAELIADATRQLGGEIEAAVAMLGEVATGSPLLARALERHEEA
ncbi:MAG: hypothetical protein ABIO29_08915 [Sphingomicrobium sp.]